MSTIANPQAGEFSRYDGRFARCAWLASVCLWLLSSRAQKEWPTQEAPARASRGFLHVQARARVGSYLPCLIDCIRLCSVRCSGGQQGTPNATKKSSSSGVGITGTRGMLRPTSWVNFVAGILITLCLSIVVYVDKSQTRPPATLRSGGQAPPNARLVTRRWLKSPGRCRWRR